MIDPEFLAMLVCPATKQPLRVADATELAAVNDRIRGGAVRNRGGTAVTEPLRAALATADGGWLYPVVDDIPNLLSSEAVATTR
jgi:uncharacterized protein YbaR (Trm112 family)